MENPSEKEMKANQKVTHMKTVSERSGKVFQESEALGYERIVLVARFGVSAIHEY